MSSVPGEILPFPQTSRYHHHSETFSLHDGGIVLWQDSQLHILDASMKRIRVTYKMSHYGRIYECSEGLVVCDSMTFIFSQNHKGSFCVLSTKRQHERRFFLQKTDASALSVSDSPQKWDYISVHQCYATPLSNFILIETDHHALYSWCIGSPLAHMVSESVPYMSVHGSTSNGQFLFSRSFQSEKGYTHELILRDSQKLCIKVGVDTRGWDIHTWFEVQKSARIFVLSKYKEPCMRFVVQKLSRRGANKEFSQECCYVHALDDTRFIVGKAGNVAMYIAMYTLDPTNLAPVLLHQDTWKAPCSGSLASLCFSTRGYLVGSVCTHYKWARHLSERQYQTFRVKVPSLRGETEVVCEDILELPCVLQVIICNYLDPQYVKKENV